MQITEGSHSDRLQMGGVEGLPATSERKGRRKHCFIPMPQEKLLVNDEMGAFI